MNAVPSPNAAGVVAEPELNIELMEILEKYEGLGREETNQQIGQLQIQADDDVIIWRQTCYGNYIQVNKNWTDEQIIQMSENVRKYENVPEMSEMVQMHTESKIEIHKLFQFFSRRNPKKLGMVQPDTLIMEAVDMNTNEPKKVEFDSNQKLTIEIMGGHIPSPDDDAMTPISKMKQFCYLCGKTLINRDSLRRHWTLVHYKEARWREEEPEEDPEEEQPMF
jgi:hypothetical protein